MVEGKTIKPEDIDWGDEAPAVAVSTAGKDQSLTSGYDEGSLDHSAYNLIDVTNTNWVTFLGEKKFVPSAGEVRAAGLQRKYYAVNNQLLVTDARGHVFLGDALNQFLRQHLEENGYSELIENPAAVPLYVPQVGDTPRKL